MEVFQAYSFGTAGWLALESLPLLFTPRLLVSLLATDPRPITQVETYLSRTLGLALLVLSTLCILLTGAIPLTTTPSSRTTSDEESEDAYAYPTVVVTTAYHAATAFYLYTQIAGGEAGFVFYAGLVGSSALFCLGIWMMVFWGQKGRRSRRTGADKRTSNFPLPNDKAARSVKKDLKESEKEKEKEKKRRSVARNGSSRGFF